MIRLIDPVAAAYTPRAFRAVVFLRKHSFTWQEDQAEVDTKRKKRQTAWITPSRKGAKNSKEKKEKTAKRQKMRK
jgi:hypothetical protein